MSRIGYVSIIFLFLQLQYNENPEDFRSEVTTFTSLRNESCVKISTNSDIGLKKLKRYYCQLAFFQNRFKVLDSPLMKKGPFDFPWREAEDDLLMGKNYIVLIGLLGCLGPTDCLGAWERVLIML